MRFDFPFGQSAEVDQQHMTVIHMRHCQNEVVIVVGQRDQVVDLILLKFECLDDVLDFHAEQVHQENLVVDCHCDLVLSDP